MSRAYGLLLACTVGGSSFCLSLQAAEPERQAEVAARSGEVMPFRLSATTHVFTKTSSGGIQRVSVKDPSDNEQLRLVRLHLAQIAEHFAAGDFSGPTRIHGPEMPGLAELRSAKRGDVNVRYEEISDGAQIEYSSTNARLTGAIHRWFDAQLSDHGADAMEGHEHHHE